ncbi:hypothetical protein HZP65_09685 [Elizabethkingia anophelis]|nr:hypothetical protein [Elizabethkingia anophelis]MCT4276882.1 hypothetical protein [Elizabethkingia anophelis]MCT4280023.1 hypothetical protein [Elizabethkingia anophelis]
MKKIIFSTVFLLGIYACAQVERLSGAMNISTGVYLKDMDNILPKFVGEWTAEYKDNQVILNIEKVEKHPSKEENVSYYRDVLFMRYTILNPDGKEIYTNRHKSITDAGALKSSSASFENKSVGIQYTGEECHIGEGYITLTYKDPTHIVWEYIAEDKPIDKAKCPNYKNIKVYIPTVYELEFTKK